MTPLITSEMDKVINKKGSVQGPLYCLLVFAIVTATVTLIRQASLPFSSVLIPALWGAGAVLPLRAGEGDMLTFGLTGHQLSRNLNYFFLSSFVVFPLYAVGFRSCVQWGLQLPVAPVLENVSIPQWLFYNFLVVALFEELFFRGYVQGRFERFAKSRFTEKWPSFWVPILASSFLFALAHMAVFLDPLRLAVFFPALLFGWLRAKTGSLIAPILSHGTANLVSMLLMGAVL